MAAVESDLLRYLARLNDAHGDTYLYDVDEGRTYYKIWKRPIRATTGKSVVAFVEKGTGLAYHAESWKKRGRLIGPVSDLGSYHPAGHGRL